MDCILFLYTEHKFLFYSGNKFSNLLHFVVNYIFINQFDYEYIQIVLIDKIAQLLFLHLPSK